MTLAQLYEAAEGRETVASCRGTAFGFAPRVRARAAAAADLAGAVELGARHDAPGDRAPPATSTARSPRVRRHGRGPRAAGRSPPAPGRRVEQLGAAQRLPSAKPPATSTSPSGSSVAT